MKGRPSTGGLEGFGDLGPGLKDRYPSAPGHGSAGVHGVERIEQHLDERIRESFREVKDQRTDEQAGRRPFDRLDAAFLALEREQASPESSEWNSKTHVLTRSER